MRLRPVITLALIVFASFVGAAFAGPSSAPAADLYNKAVALYQKGRWSQAREYFHQYLAEFSDTPLYTTCLYYLAYCYQQLGDDRQAATLYHKVLDGALGGDSFWREMAENRLLEMGVKKVPLTAH